MLTLVGHVNALMIRHGNVASLFDDPATYKASVSSCLLRRELNAGSSRSLARTHLQGVLTTRPLQAPATMLVKINAGPCVHLVMRVAFNGQSVAQCVRYLSSWDAVGICPDQLPESSSQPEWSIQSCLRNSTDLAFVCDLSIFGIRRNHCLCPSRWPLSGGTSTLGKRRFSFFLRRRHCRQQHVTSMCSYVSDTFHVEDPLITMNRITANPA
ncbi:hypothetical protein OE88DRAFT_1014996 [Heliocybe sulcata]|uniref:Uncharacterized protein n=1 Tax=Heliocybe sulcata TaxID=5364 RepID=A0A5C3NNK7_9AGAM|nr:hypothetical protein OE88DRAFT_1014996 [Heliocybe sulcata]